MTHQHTKKSSEMLQNHLSTINPVTLFAPKELILCSFLLQVDSLDMLAHWTILHDLARELAGLGKTQGLTRYLSMLSLISIGVALLKCNLVAIFGVVL